MSRSLQVAEYCLLAGLFIAALAFLGSEAVHAYPCEYPERERSAATICDDALDVRPLGTWFAVNADSVFKWPKDQNNSEDPASNNAFPKVFTVFTEWNYREPNPFSTQWGKLELRQFQLYPQG